MRSGWRMGNMSSISIWVLFPISVIEEGESSTSYPTDSHCFSSFMNTETCEWCHMVNFHKAACFVHLELCLNMKGMWGPLGVWAFCGPNSWWNGASRAHAIQFYDGSYNLALCLKPHSVWSEARTYKTTGHNSSSSFPVQARYVISSLVNKCFI